MSTLREQFSAARKAQVEIQLDFVRNLTNNVFDSTGKVVALNLSTGRNSIEKSADTLRKLVTAKSTRDLLDLSRESQSSFDTLLTYGSELFNIASRAQANLIKAATPAAVTAASAPAQALRALPSAEVEVEVQAEVQPAAEPVKADPDAVAAVPLDEVQAAVEVQAEPVTETQPLAEPQAAAEPEPAAAIAEEVPVPGDALQAKPLAEAVSEAVGEAQPPVLEASPVVTAAPSQVEISGIEPVDATPPQAPVQTEAPVTKSRRKKER